MSDRPDFDRDDRPDTAQPPPVHVPGGESVHDLLVADLHQRFGETVPAHLIADVGERKAFGLRKYGVPLTAHNGRDAGTDAYEEAHDLAVYLRQAVAEGAPVEVAYRTVLDLLVWLSTMRIRDGH